MTYQEETLQALKSTHDVKAIAEAVRAERIRSGLETEDLDHIIERYERRIKKLNELLEREEE